MYSRRIIESVISEFSRKNGWEPTFRSPQEVAEFNAYIESITDKITNKLGSSFDWKPGREPTAKRAAWIRRWIHNERFLCFADAEYFVTRYAKIRAVDERIISFEFRLGQRIFLDVLSEFDDNQLAIQVFVLKARQVGLSTVVALFFLHRILFRANTHAIMASAQVGQSEKLGMMIDTAWDRLPFWLPPGKSSIRSKEPKWDNGSALSVQAGSQTVGIAQGSTPTCLPPSTLIRIQHGFTRAISRLVSGDVVTTHKGDLTTVVRAWRTERTAEPTKKIKICGNYDPLECTFDHMINTPKGWVEAEELSAGDYVRHPITPIAEPIGVLELDHLTMGNGVTEKLSIPYTFDLGYVAGLYLAEGSIHNAKNISEIVFTVHKREAEDRYERIRRVVGDRWTTSQRKHNENGVQIKVYCSWLARWIAENFGRRLDKHVPDWSFSAGKEFCSGILKGYFDGDGHCEKTSNHVKVPTICSQIAYQMRDLVASLGLGWSAIYFRPAHRQGKMWKRDVWWLVLTGPTGKAYRQRFGFDWRESTRGPSRSWKVSEDGFIDVKIEAIADGWSEEFWDIEVAHSDHSFLTTQCAVHNCIHLSEIADYDNPIKTIEEGLFPAAHQTSSLFFVMEGTGSMASPWQKDKWNEYKSNWGKGGRFRTIFIPPACASDIYPTKDWLRGNPVPEAWNPPIEVLRMKRRCEIFVRSTDYLAKHLGADWEMGLEYMWFWSLGYKESVKSHSEKTFLAMNAVTDQDAFQSKNDPVFSDEVIEVVTKERHRDYKAYAITGKTIIVGRDYRPYEPPVHEIDYSSERIPLRWEANDGNVYTWELVPLRPFDDSSDEACFNKLLVFEPPQDGRKYSQGIDVAQGLGLPNEDRSCSSVLRNEWGRDRDIQAASFTSLDVNAAQMARIAAAIATFYTTDGSGGMTSGDPMGMKFIIEQIRKSGDECLNQLILMGFYNHHVMHFYDDKDSMTNPDKGKKLGWRTVEWSRDILLSKFVNYTNMGWFKPNDPILIRQLKTFIRRKVGEDKAKMIHEKGEHDDNIFANAMALLTAHDIEIEASRITKRYNPIENYEETSEEWCTGMVEID